MDQVEQTIGRYQRYLSMDPNNRELLFTYGDALHAGGKFTEAKDIFQKLLALDANDAIAQSRFASVLISCHDFSGAEAILRKLIADGAEDPAIKFNLALACYCEEKFEDAASVFADLTETEPMADDARYYFVSCQHNLGRNSDAIARAQQFLAQRSSSKLAGYLALVQFDALELNAAIQQAKAVLQEQPDNVDAATVLGTYAIEQQNMDEAERHLQLVTEREPNNIRGWQGLGLVALYRQHYDEAIRHLNTAIGYAPKDVGNYNTLGWIYIITRRFAEAEHTFRKGIAINRNVAEAHGGLAAALAYQQKIDDARREIDLAAGLDPRNFGMQVARTVVLKQRGNERNAEETFAKMLRAPLRDADQTLMQALVDYWKKSKK